MGDDGDRHVRICASRDNWRTCFTVSQTVERVINTACRYINTVLVNSAQRCRHTVPGLEAVVVVVVAVVVVVVEVVVVEVVVVAVDRVELTEHQHNQTVQHT